MSNNLILLFFGLQLSFSLPIIKTNLVKIAEVLNIGFLFYPVLKDSISECQ